MEEAASEIELKKALCIFCAKKISKTNIKRHEDNCSKNTQTTDNFKEITHFQEHVQHFKCEYCNRLFKRSDNLKAHLRETCPFQEHLQNFKCDNCHQLFKRSSNLKAHIKKCLSQEHIPKKSFLLCNYAGCSYKSITLSLLIDHLQRTHNTPMICSQTLNFENENYFIDWKEEEQARTFSYFSKKCGNHNSVEGLTKYFYCQQHGSGKAHNKAGELDRKTNRRVAHGRIKSGQICISSMKATYSKDGSVTVIYQPTHSHPLNPSSIRLQPLSKESYKYIDKQLAVGTSPLIIKRDLKNRAIQKASLLNLENKDNYKDCFVSLKLIKERARRKRNLIVDASKSITLPEPSSDEKENVKRKWYREIWKNRLKENLNKMLSLVENDNVPDHILSKMNVEVDLTLKHSKALLGNVKEVPMMTGSVSHTLNEKLKAQVSQGLSLKRPNRRRKPFNADSAAKKRAVSAVILRYGNSDVKATTCEALSQPSLAVDQCSSELISCQVPTLTHESPLQEVKKYESVVEEDGVFFMECDIDCNTGSMAGLQDYCR